MIKHIAIVLIVLAVMAAVAYTAFGVAPDRVMVGGGADAIAVKEPDLLPDPPMGDEIRAELARINSKPVGAISKGDVQTAKLLAKQLSDSDRVLHVKEEQRDMIKTGTQVMDIQLMSLLEQSDKHIAEIKQAIDANKQLLADISNKIQSKNGKCAQDINRLIKCPVCPLMEATAIAAPADVSKMGFNTLAKTTWKPIK